MIVKSKEDLHKESLFWDRYDVELVLDSDDFLIELPNLLPPGALLASLSLQGAPNASHTRFSKETLQRVLQDSFRVFSQKGNPLANLRKLAFG